jgi:hypothetical protein
MTIGKTFAAPIEGETASNAAAILFLIGGGSIVRALLGVETAR